MIIKPTNSVPGDQETSERSRPFSEEWVAEVRELAEEVIGLYRTIWESNKALGLGIVILSEPWRMWYGNDYGILWSHSPFKYLKQYHLRYPKKLWPPPDTFRRSLRGVITRQYNNIHLASTPILPNLEASLEYYRNCFRLIIDKYLPYIMNFEAAREQLIHKLAGFYSALLQVEVELGGRKVEELLLPYHNYPLIADYYVVMRRPLLEDVCVETRGGEKHYVFRIFKVLRQIIQEIRQGLDPGYLSTPTGLTFVYDCLLSARDILSQVASLYGINIIE